MFLLCHVVCYSSLILLVGFLCLSRFRERSYRRAYSIDKDDFKDAVFNGVTNVIYSYVYPTNSTSNKARQIIIKPYTGGCYQDIYGRLHTLVEGFDLVVGDFFDDGSIVDLGDNFFAVSSFDGERLTYYKRMLYPPSAPLPAQAGGGDEGERQLSF